MNHFVAGLVIGFLIGAILHNIAIQDAKRAEFVRDSKPVMYSQSSIEANR